MSADALQRYLADAIPLVGAMGVTTVRADAGGVELRAPLEPNRNHQSTAFGGSIAALATLACWGWVWLALPGARIVVARSTVDYAAPVTSGFNARCAGPDGDAREVFLQAFARKGRARVELAAVVTDDAGAECARFSGTFAAAR